MSPTCQSDMHPEDRKRVLSSIQRVVAQREPEHHEDADTSIAYAVDGATRMQALINDLLASRG